MACDDRPISSSNNGDSSDDDSFIDLYAHVEQQSRRAVRRDPQCLSSDEDDSLKSPSSNRKSTNSSSKGQSKGILGSFLETNQKTGRSKPGNRSVSSAPAVVRNMSSDASGGSRQTASGSVRQQKSKDGRSEEFSNRSTSITSQRSSFSTTQSSRFGRSNSSSYLSSSLAVPGRNTAPRRTQSARSLLQPSSRDRVSAYGKSVGSSSLSRNRIKPDVTASSARGAGAETVMEAKLREIRSKQEALRKKTKDIKRQVWKERQVNRSSRRNSTTNVAHRPHRLADTLVGSSTTNTSLRRSSTTGVTQRSHRLSDTLVGSSTTLKQC